MQRFRKRPGQRQGSALQECRSRCRYSGGADRGFTLTEVLVVALIIGILLALVSAAVFPVLDTAKEFGIYSEAAKLKLAMEQLKSQYGANPPADLTELLRVIWRNLLQEHFLGTRATCQSFRIRSTGVLSIRAMRSFSGWSVFRAILPIPSATMTSG